MHPKSKKNAYADYLNIYVKYADSKRDKTIQMAALYFRISLQLNTMRQQY